MKSRSLLIAFFVVAFLSFSAVEASKAATSADAKPFLDYLKSATARSAFGKQGFAVLVKSASST